MSSALLRRVGAVGDIHAEDDRLAAALKYLANAAVDTVLAVGDIVDGPGDELRCCELLAQHHVDVVMGNHDRWLLEGAEASPAAARATHHLTDYLRALPSTREFRTCAGPLLLCHGLGENDMNRLTEDDYGYALETNDELQAILRRQYYRYVIGGHTHRRMVKDFGGVTVINVGTLFRENDPCFAVIDFAGGEVVFHDFDRSGAITTTHSVPL